MNEEIKLTLDPVKEETGEEVKEDAAVEKEEVSTVIYDYTGAVLENVKLSPEEARQVEEFAKTIDITDTDTLMQYGSQSQQKIAGFSDTALEKVKARDMGEVGELLSDLVAELKENSPTESKGFLGLFKKPLPAEKLKAKYTLVEKDVDNVTGTLTDHRNSLIKDVAMLSELYDTNLSCFKEITMYILAGKKAVEDAKNGKLKELQEEAKRTGLAEDAQAAADYGDLIQRFEKKLYDLELTRAVNMQMAPQIRLIQNNDVTMSEKIQSTIVNTIPLWKNQMVIALGLSHTQEALKAEKAVNDLTNELLKKNAEILKQGTIEVAKENERGIVDIETLTETNQKLIDTLEEVTAIQKEGRENRLKAEQELCRIEDDLKVKLLELSSTAAKKEQ